MDTRVPRDYLVATADYQSVTGRWEQALKFVGLFTLHIFQTLSSVTLLAVLIHFPVFLLGSSTSYASPRCSDEEKYEALNTLEISCAVIPVATYANY